MRKNQNYTGTTNHGKNRTDGPLKKAIYGTNHKLSGTTRGAKYNKAVEDARAAFLMQSGYIDRRSNFDIVSPVRTAKENIKGNSTYMKKNQGGQQFVDEYDKAVVRTGKKSNFSPSTNGDDGGPDWLRDYDRAVKRTGEMKGKGLKNHAPAGRTHTSERKPKIKADYAPMMDAEAPSAIWDKSRRYRDAAGRGKHVKKKRNKNKKK